jgi:hypothetical protein
MRVFVRTQSSAWEVVEQEGMPDDAQNAVVYVRQAIEGGELLKCRLAEGASAERWVVFYSTGVQYIAAEE